MNNMEVGKESKGVKEQIGLCFHDWIDGNSILHDPLICIEGGWSYPRRKPL